jgi:hydrogenase-4 membrane subunit HyfE
VDTTAALGTAGALVTAFLANLLAVNRMARGAVYAYAATSLTEAVLAFWAGTVLHEASWWALAGVWFVAKVIVVPRIIARAADDARYGATTPGTPRLALGSFVIFAVLAWAGGPVTLPVAALLTAFWLLAVRAELYVEALLLLEAEVAVGFLAIRFALAPGWSDAVATVETVATAVLLAWLDREARRRFGTRPTALQLTELQG